MDIPSASQKIIGGASLIIGSETKSNSLSKKKSVPVWSLTPDHHSMAMPHAISRMTRAHSETSSNAHNKYRSMNNNNPTLQRKKKSRVKVREGYYSEQVRNKAFGEVALGQRQEEVLNVIRICQPISNEEIADIIGVPPHYVTPRVLELRKFGHVEFFGTSTSPTSKRTVSLWRIKPEGQQLVLPLAKHKSAEEQSNKK